jgi:hypothetical protein
VTIDDVVEHLRTSQKWRPLQTHPMRRGSSFSRFLAGSPCYTDLLLTPAPLTSLPFMKVMYTQTRVWYLTLTKC